MKKALVLLFVVAATALVTSHVVKKNELNQVQDFDLVSEQSTGYMNSDSVNEAEVEESTESTESTQAIIYQSLNTVAGAFTIPTSWLVQDNTYTTPAGSSGVVGHTLYPNWSNPQSSDVILIGGRQATCMVLSLEYNLCVDSQNQTPIYTNSLNQEILDIFTLNT